MLHAHTRTAQASGVVAILASEDVAHNGFVWAEWAERVGPRQVYQIGGSFAEMGQALSAFDGDARVVADLGSKARDGVEKGGLSGSVWPNKASD